MVTLILGGARSGKSRLAQRMASQSNDVIFIATAAADGDPSMEARIARHRQDRPAGWRTIEEPLGIGEAVERVASEAATILIDCLTVWLSNLFWEYRERGHDAADGAARSQLERIVKAAERCRVILVSNEVGLGIVPERELGRDFRDSQGLLNQLAAELADEVICTIAGLPLYLKRAEGRE